MIQSRWQNTEEGYAGACLQSVQFVVYDLNYNFWWGGSDPCKRLIKFWEEGLDISIIDYNTNEDLLRTAS